MQSTSFWHIMLVLFSLLLGCEAHPSETTWKKCDSATETSDFLVYDQDADHATIRVSEAYLDKNIRYEIEADVYENHEHRLSLYSENTPQVCFEFNDERRKNFDKPYRFTRVVGTVRACENDVCTEVEPFDKVVRAIVHPLNSANVNLIEFAAGKSHNAAKVSVERMANDCDSILVGTGDPHKEHGFASDFWYAAKEIPHACSLAVAYRDGDDGSGDETISFCNSSKLRVAAVKEVSEWIQDAEGSPQMSSFGFSKGAAILTQLFHFETSSLPFGSSVSVFDVLKIRGAEYLAGFKPGEIYGDENIDMNLVFHADNHTFDPVNEIDGYAGMFSGLKLVANPQLHLNYRRSEWRADYPLFFQFLRDHHGI